MEPKTNNLFSSLKCKLCYKTYDHKGGQMYCSEADKIIHKSDQVCPQFKSLKKTMME